LIFTTTTTNTNTTTRFPGKNTLALTHLRFRSRRAGSLGASHTRGTTQEEEASADTSAPSSCVGCRGIENVADLATWAAIGRRPRGQR
jgi:hypothetical protein